MCELTQEEALRLAGALVAQAVKEAEGRCSVVAQFITDCERAQSRTAAWNEAVRELSALHGYRSGLLHRQSLIQQALDCAIGECPKRAPLSASPGRAVPRTRQQVQVQVRRRRS
jgi:hypothetical protein